MVFVVVILVPVRYNVLIRTNVLKGRVMFALSFYGASLITISAISFSNLDLLGCHTWRRAPEKAIMVF